MGLKPPKKDSLEEAREIARKCLIDHEERNKDGVLEAFQTPGIEESIRRVVKAISAAKQRGFEEAVELAVHLAESESWMHPSFRRLEWREDAALRIAKKINALKAPIETPKGEKGDAG